MSRLGHNSSLRFIKSLNAILLTIPFVICWMEYYAERTVSPYDTKGNLIVCGLFLVLYVLFGRVYDSFLISLNRISEMIYSQGLAALLADAIMYVVITLLTKCFPNILPLLLAFFVQLFFAVSWSVLAHNWYFAVFQPKRSAVIYDVRRGMEDLIAEYDLGKKFRIEHTASVEECLKAEMKTLEGLEAVFLCGVHSHDRNLILKYCVTNDITVYMLPRIGDVIMSGARQMHMFHLPMLRVDRYNPVPEYVALKRMTDLLVSAAALLILSPVMLITAIAIKIGDGGPIFYKQCRLTKDGKQFYIMKFRSMRIDAEKDGIARLSTGTEDNRITPVGKLIRKVRLDELPQLFNILSGDMSLVGPRPERPEIAEQYEKELPEFKLRLQAKAGLTGYAQVYGKYNTTPYDKLQMDLMYIANPSILEDLRIMFATVKILFLPESTEGIAEGNTTASMEAAATTVQKGKK